MSIQAYAPAESEKRYEVVLKHYLEGVIHMAYFEELDKAHSWLMARWEEVFKRTGAKDAYDRADFQSSYGGAIYDQQQERKRVMILGVDYVTNERRGDKRS